MDVVFDLVGGDYGVRSLRCLRPDGLLLTAVERTNTDLAVTTVAAGDRFAGIAVEPDRLGLEDLALLVDHGRLRPHVAHVLPFEHAAEAHHLLDAGRLTGKIVLRLRRRVSATAHRPAS